MFEPTDRRPAPPSLTSKEPTTDQGWTTTGDFVGTGPVAGAIGDQQPVSGYLGQKLVNTFLNHDLSTGTIDSPTFTINSDYIDFLVGGGFHPYTGAPYSIRAPDRPPSTWSSAARSSTLLPGRTTRR